MANNIYKKVLLFIGLFIFRNIGFSQINPINILRYNDNFTAVKSDTVKKGFTTLKYIPIGKKTYVSFGGELREQYQHFNNLNFGDVPPATKEISTGQLWHRVMVHSNVEIGSQVRIFVQLNSTFRFFNPNPVTPEIDENQLSLHQAFIDYKFGKHFILRAGRQEMGYGNNRILTFREGPNTRLAFDAVVLKYTNQKRKIDLLALTPVVSKQFVFDDQSFKETVFGIYGTEFLVPKKLLLDYYVLSFGSDIRKYNFITGKETRQSFGLRFFSQNPTFNYELETAYQTGKFNNSKIRAYAFSADASYVLNKTNSFIIGVSGNYISGDKDKTDNILNTYNLIFSKPSYGLAAPIGSSNITNVNPYLKINPIKKLNVYAGVYFLSRQSNQDGTYSPGMAQVRPTPANLFTSAKKAIGTQYAVETGYNVNQHFFFAVDAAYLKADSYVKETGKGKDITYLSFKAAFKF
jgi:Alginate export